MLRHIKSALDVVSTVAVIAAAGALLWRMYNPPTPPGQRAPVETVKDLSLPANSIRHVRGNGPVAVIAFSDYECPFCARHVQETGPAIKSKLLDAGVIREVYLNFPLPIHAKAQKAGEAAECAAQQGRFWEMHEALFENSKALEITDLAKHAERLGLDQAKFGNCLESGETAAAIQRDLAEGKRLAVSATPAFFIGLVRDDGTVDLRKRINGALGFEDFEKVVTEVRPARRASAPFEWWSPRPEFQRAAVR